MLLPEEPGSVKGCFAEELYNNCTFVFETFTKHIKWFLSFGDYKPSLATPVKKRPLYFWVLLFGLSIRKDMSEPGRSFDAVLACSCEKTVKHLRKNYSDVDPFSVHKWQAIKAEFRRPLSILHEEVL